jgi:hypothetical protein
LKGWNFVGGYIAFSLVHLARVYFSPGFCVSRRVTGIFADDLGSVLLMLLTGEHSAVVIGGHL